MRENTSILTAIANKATVGTKITEAQMVASANLLAGSEKFNAGNLLPSDHSGVLVNGKLEKQPGQARQYADLIFHKVGRGLYEVVPASARTPMPASSSRRASADPIQARKDALALLGLSESDVAPKVIPATQTAIPAAVVTGQGNGAAKTVPATK